MFHNFYRISNILKIMCVCVWVAPSCSWKIPRMLYLMFNCFHLSLIFIKWVLTCIQIYILDESRSPEGNLKLLFILQRLKWDLLYLSFLNLPMFGPCYILILLCVVFSHTLFKLFFFCCFFWNEIFFCKLWLGAVMSWMIYTSPGLTLLLVTGFY